MQLQHHNTNFTISNFEIVLLCDGVHSPANKGSLLRLADSFGVKKIIFGNTELDISSPRLKRTARATQKWIATDTTNDILGTIHSLQEDDYIPVALEITNQSIALQEIDFLHLKKILLIIGDERAGVTDAVLQKCEVQTHINMFGKNTSMNVSQAASIALYEITKQLTNVNK